jgi:hypothetical protein
MRLNGWLLSVLLVFISLEALGILFWNTFAGATAVFTLTFSLIFLGLFVFSYLWSIFSAGVNPWANDVDHMDGPILNPMYLTWLFENNRLEWSLWTTLFDVITAPVIGLLVFLIATTGYPTQWNGYTSAGGFLIGCAFLVFYGVCWAKGFCKVVWADWAKTETPIPESVLEEWRDKRL